MPQGFSAADWLGGAEAVEAVKNVQSLYQQKEQDLWDKIVDTTKQVLPKALSSAQAAMAQLSYSGSTGDFLSSEENIVLTAKFFRVVEQLPSKIGCPYYKADFINTFSGFVQCRNAVFGNSIATVVEENAIEDFLNSGFYYE